MTRSLRTDASFGTGGAVPSAWRARRVRTAAAEIAVYETGAGTSEAPVALLLHGLGHWTDAAWARLIPHLDPALRYVAFDLPGFGASEKPDVRYDRAFFRRVLGAVVAVLGLERFALVGHSLGGFIAADWAGAHPARVTRLALIAPAGFGRSPRHLLYALVARAAARPLSTLPPSKRFVERILHGAVADASSIDTEHLEHAYAQAQELALRRAFVGVYSSVLDVYAGADPRRDFARYTGPVLCAWGAQDRYLPITALPEVRRTYPHAETLVLDASAHLPMLEEPRRLGESLRAFLAESRVGPASSP